MGASSVYRELYKLANDENNYSEKILASLIAICVAFILYYVLKKITYKFVFKEKRRVRILSTLRWLLFFVATSFILYSWFNAIEGLLVGVSVIAGLLLISLKDLAINFAGYVYIKIRKPFKPGDRIEIDGYIGDVESIEILEFNINEVKGWLRSKQHTGVDLHIPNKYIFNTVLKNYTQEYPYLWIDISFTFDASSNIEKAEEIFLKIGQEELKKLVKREQNRKEMKTYLDKLSNDLELINDNILPNVSTDSVFDGLEMNLRVVVPYDEIGPIKSRIEKAIVKAVQEEDDLIFASRNHLVVNK